MGKKRESSIKKMELELKKTCSNLGRTETPNNTFPPTIQRLRFSLTLNQVCREASRQMISDLCRCSPLSW